MPRKILGTCVCCGDAIFDHNIDDIMVGNSGFYCGVCTNRITLVKKKIIELLKVEKGATGDISTKSKIKAHKDAVKYVALSVGNPLATILS